ncbi:hypothetical protein FGB62_72g019 [Gracilaria domingensis]|nr:hypothetical protein FGB62_72g019 [Gracilaria domingensis]
MEKRSPVVRKAQAGVTEGGAPKYSLETQEEEEHVHDLPGYVYSLCEDEGYAYGVQFFKTYKKKPPGTGCKASFLAKARSDGSGWTITRSGWHNHMRLYPNERGSKDKRRKSVKNAVKNSCPTGFQGRFVHFIPPELKKTTPSDNDDFMEGKLPPLPPNRYGWLSRSLGDDGEYMRSKNSCGPRRELEIIAIDDNEKRCASVERSALNSVIAVDLSDDSSVIEMTAVEKTKSSAKPKSVSAF